MIQVELIGSPGSGKSTIMTALVRELRKSSSVPYYTAEEAQFVVAQKEIEKVYRTIMRILPQRLAKSFFSRIDHRSFWHEANQGRFLAKYYKGLQQLFSWHDFAGMSERDKGILLMSFLKSGAVHESISPLCSTNAVVLYDEGLLQKSMMFVRPDGSVNNREHVQRYLSGIPLPDIAVCLELNVSDCHDRMLSRQKGLIRRMRGNGGGVLQFLDQSRRHWQLVLDRLNDLTEIDVLVQPSSGKLNVVVSELVRSLTDLIQKRAGRTNGNG